MDTEASDLFEIMKEIDTSKYQIVLPINGSEDSELLKMGIEFGPFQKGDKWRGANLPDGWVFHKRDKESYICDDRKRARAIIYIGAAIIRPIQRFRIGTDSYVSRPDENIRLCIWDSNVVFPRKPKVVFEVTHPLPNRSQHLEAHNNRAGIYKNDFDKKAKAWLADKYPDWESYSGHWDEEDEESNHEEDKQDDKQEDKSKDAKRSSSESSGDQDEVTQIGEG